jgi:hypothetical protein
MGELDRTAALAKMVGSGAGDPPVYITPAAFDVSVLPEDWAGPGGRYPWTIRVEWRAASRNMSRWAVCWGGHRCLGRDGQWDWESIPSGREDEWLDEHRFSLEEALDLARKHAPEVSVNGHRAIDVLGRARGGQR